MSVSIPAFDQARKLPLVHEQVIPPNFTDANGHMNIVRYMKLHNDAGWAYMARFGLGEEEARHGQAGSFDVEQHLRYFREVHAGEAVAIHVRLLGRSATALHAMHFLVNVTHAALANTFESLSLSVDMSTRRVAPFPDDVAARLDEQLARDTVLDWQPPLASTMGPR